MDVGTEGVRTSEWHGLQRPQPSRDPGLPGIRRGQNSVGGQDSAVIGQITQMPYDLEGPVGQT